MKRFYYFIVISLLIFGCSSNEDNDSIIPGPTSIDSSDSSDNDNQEPEQSFADIDFSNWKVTLPVDENNTGSPDEYQPADLINGGYRTNTSIQPYMYDDLNDSSIEFYTLPGVSTTNSSYSRTELRELENPSNAKDNWTLQEGGTMTGKLKIVEISEDNENAN
ncbi:MAG: polysaccharide lyase family 7 protein, partial [Winogradskyella sp.]|nr:polysaccharide lyase family 7 protein [Winogradskyella sp.]